MSELINIADELTDKGIAELTLGQILRFKDGELITELKVVKKNIRKREVWVRPVVTFLPEELGGTVKVVDK